MCMNRFEKSFVPILLLLGLLPYLMRQNSTHFSVMFTLLSIGNRVARVVTFGKKLLSLACKFKIVTFVTAPPKVVTISLDW